MRKTEEEIIIEMIGILQHAFHYIDLGEVEARKQGFYHRDISQTLFDRIKTYKHYIYDDNE